MDQAVMDFFRNIKSGLRLSVFQRLELDDFRPSSDQLVLLLILNILAAVCRDFFANLPSPEFNPDAIIQEGFSIGLFLFAGYLINRWISHQEVFLDFTVIILSVCFPLLLIGEVLKGLGGMMFDGSSPTWFSEWSGLVYSFWTLGVLAWSLGVILGGWSIRVAGALVLIVIAWVAPVEYVTPDGTYWNSIEEEQDDPYQAYRSVDVEGVFYSQSELLDQELQFLKPGEVGQRDVYFLGMGAYAFQDVFLKETVYAKNLFDERFGTKGRSLVLLNNLSTYESMPIASTTNLRKALHHIGSIMNRDEDLLLIYMTSHGSQDHRLTVNFWPLTLNDLSPEMLRQYLDEAGIQWRVIMVSSCYSGGFVEPLKTAYTAIATAAASDRKSFGCSHDRDFTYFGEALLRDQLREEYSFPVAFFAATSAIGIRESEEGLKGSQPQTYIGEGMNIYLNEFALSLQRDDSIQGMYLVREK